MDHPAIETLARALAALDADACVKIVEEVGRAVGPERLLEEIYLPALSRLGDIWARGLLDDLAFAQAAVIAEQLWGMIAPARSAGGGEATGPAVVVGVLAPDRHDIGKNQVARLLAEAGARVTDLGTQVEPEEFADRAREAGAAVIYVGAATQPALARLKEVRTALDDAGLSASVLVGGQAASCAHEVEGADAVVADGHEAVDLALASGAGSSSGSAADQAAPGGAPVG